MEDYEAQEVEFWRKLDEKEMSRSQMLKRSVAAATGLTVLASPGLAWARERGIRVAPPLKGKGFSMKELVAQAKKEGKLNTIALPPDWANYGEIMSTFKKKYGITIDDAEPGRQLGARRTRPCSRSRATRARRTSSTTGLRSRSPAPRRVCSGSTSSPSSARSRGR